MLIVALEAFHKEVENTLLYGMIVGQSKQTH